MVAMFVAKYHFVFYLLCMVVFATYAGKYAFVHTKGLHYLYLSWALASQIFALWAWGGSWTTTPVGFGPHAIMAVFWSAAMTVALLSGFLLSDHLPPIRRTARRAG